MPLLPPGLRGMAAMLGADPHVVVVWEKNMSSREVIAAWMDGGDEFEAAVLKAAGADPKRWTIYDSALLAPTPDGSLRERLYLQRR